MSEMDTEKILLEKKLHIANILNEKYKESEKVLKLVITKRVNIEEVANKDYHSYLLDNASIVTASKLLTEDEYNTIAEYIRRYS